MKKLNIVLLVLAGTIGCGAYASQQEPQSPRTLALAKFESTLDSYDFDAKHVSRMIRLKSKIDREFEAMEKKQRQEVEAAKRILESIAAARKIEGSQAQQKST